MSELGHSVTAFLLHYLTHSIIALPLVAVAAWIGARMLRRVGPRAQHRMWVCALLCGVFLPLLPAGLMSLTWRHSADPAVATSSSFLMQAMPLRERLALPPAMYAGLAAFYLLSILFSGSRLLWRWRRTQQLADVSPLFSQTRETGGLLREAARRFDVAEPEVRSCALLDGPVVLGVRRAVLLLPEDFLESTAAGDVAAALAHECAHIRRRDFAKNLAYECVAAMVAYHPVCWWIRRHIAQTRELVCDEMAAGVPPNRNDYAASLLRLAMSMADRAAAAPLNAIGMFDSNSLKTNALEERIMHLTTDRPKLSNTKKTLFTAMAGCALLGGAITAAAMGFDVNTQPKETIYHVGPGVTPPVLVYATDAEFPDAKGKTAKAGWHGISVVGLTVDSNGMVRDLHTLRSLTPDFDKCAIDAVRTYRFKPAMHAGAPVAVSIVIEVNFRKY